VDDDDLERVEGALRCCCFWECECRGRSGRCGCGCAGERIFSCAYGYGDGRVDRRCDGGSREAGSRAAMGVAGATRGDVGSGVCLEAVAVALALAGGGGGSGGGGDGGWVLDCDDGSGEGLQLGDEVAGTEVAEKGLVGLGVVVGALDEDALEEASDDLGRGVAPDLGGARGEREGVRLDVAEDQHLVAAVVVADEEGGAVVDAGFVEEVVVGVLRGSDGAEIVGGCGVSG